MDSYIFFLGGGGIQEKTFLLRITLNELAINSVAGMLAQVLCSCTCAL